MATVNPKFIINLKGKEFVMLGGLLELAHNGGLIGIETILDKDLSDPKEQIYVFQAIGRFRTDTGEAIWSAYGDCCPSNSQMRGAYLRHAETRAIARMLRMATNVAMCSVEELGPDGNEETSPRSARPGVASRELPARVAAADGANRNRQQMDTPAGPVRQEKGPVVEPTPDPYFCAKCGVEVPERNAVASVKLTGMVFCPVDGRAYREEQELLAKANVPAQAVAA